MNNKPYAGVLLIPAQLAALMSLLTLYLLSFGFL